MISLRRPNLVATMPPEHSHRLRHHGKNHQSDVTTHVIADVINNSSIHSHLHTTDSVCYTTNEVLVIIGLTCVLNLAFIAVVMSCVHFCSSASASITKLSTLESLLLVDNTSSDSELELWDQKRHSPCRRHTIDDYLRSFTIPLQTGVNSKSCSSSMFSLHSLVPSCWPSTSSPRQRLQSSLSMDNLLFV